MSAQLGDNTPDQIRNMSHKIAEFIALYERAEEKLIAREKALDSRAAAEEARINAQMFQMRSVLGEFQEVMTESGAARCRLAAESALKEGKEHLQSIEEATEDFIKLAQHSCDRLEEAADYAVKNVNKAVRVFQPKDFKNITRESCDQIKQTCLLSVRKVSDVIRWFHWRNLGMALSITIAVTMITGLYMNDEWPWEMHQQVMQERNFAEAVVSSWPHLNKTDQREILHSATKRIQ